MKTSEKTIAKWQKALTDLNLINGSDKVEDYVVANWESFNILIFGNWRRGTLIFTKQKLVYMTSLGINQFVVDYEDIREAKKCFAGLLPMGMQVMAYNKKTDKVKRYKFWLSSRGKWIRFIADKAGLAN